MRYIEAPEKAGFRVDEQRLFLAGGITGCPDWQAKIVALLSDTALAIVNPRRKDFPIHDPAAAYDQIAWEFKCLRLATMILFWFPCESLCPIALYELGAWSMSRAPIFVGIHPDYQRRQDVEIQTMLARPKVQIVYSLESLAASVRDSKHKEKT